MATASSILFQIIASTMETEIDESFHNVTDIYRRDLGYVYKMYAHITGWTR
jgi:hypothetical protein